MRYKVDYLKKVIQGDWGQMITVNYLPAY